MESYKQNKFGGSCYRSVHNFLLIVWLQKKNTIRAVILNVIFCRPENKSLMRTECGPGSSVGIATGYGLNGPGIESRWGRDFPHLSRLALGPTQPPV